MKDGSFLQRNESLQAQCLKVSWFKRQMSSKEDGNLPGIKRRLVSPNYYNFENTGLSGKNVEKGVAALD